MSNNFAPGGTKVITLLSGAEETTDGEWFRLPRDKVFSVEGITTATVVLEYKTHQSQTGKTLDTFTADGDKANSDALAYVRARVTVYTSGNISVYCAIAGN